MDKSFGHIGYSQNDNKKRHQSKWTSSNQLIQKCTLVKILTQKIAFL
jgi:hypothetical protein